MSHIVVFDSGLGGLSVLKEVQAAQPDATITYVADTAGFPYGALSESDVVRRVLAIFKQLTADFLPDLAVIACNTASTLVLSPLRAAYAFPFVGTVPAIKPAAEQTRSGVIGVLATPGTVERDYTRALIDTYASHIDVTLVGADNLADLAEAAMRGEPVADANIAREIAPVFKNNGGARTDVVVLGCTHYPLILDQLDRLAPWPVTWIDPAPAIARRVTSLTTGQPEIASTNAETTAATAAFTAVPENSEALARVLHRYGVRSLRALELPSAVR